MQQFLFQAVCVNYCGEHLPHFLRYHLDIALHQYICINTTSSTS